MKKIFLVLTIIAFQFFYSQENENRGYKVNIGDFPQIFH